MPPFQEEERRVPIGRGRPYVFQEPGEQVDARPFPSSQVAGIMFFADIGMEFAHAMFAIALATPGKLRLTAP